MEEKKKIDPKHLKDVNGGGFFSDWRDSDYEDAGVEIVGKGLLYNDGYRFNGVDISTEDAGDLAFLYYYRGFRAESLEAARNYRNNFLVGC